VGRSTLPSTLSLNDLSQPPVPKDLQM